MRTVLPFLFFGWLMILMLCADAARRILWNTRPATLRLRLGVPPSIEKLGTMSILPLLPGKIGERAVGGLINYSADLDRIKT